MIYRILKIYKIFLLQNLKKEMIYRANFFASLFIDMMNIFIPVIFFKVIFAENEFIAGWNFESTLILVGLVGVMREAAYITFRGGFELLGNAVRTGRLDFILIKPFSPQLMTAFREISVNESIGEGIAGLGLVVYGALNLDPLPDLDNLLMFAFFTICSYALYYSFSLVVNSSAFWILKSDGFNALVWNFMEMARYPRGILRGVFKMIFTFIIPASIIANVPAQALIGDLRLDVVLIFLAVTAAFSIMANFIWKNGLKRYESASS